MGDGERSGSRGSVTGCKSSPGNENVYRGESCHGEFGGGVASWKPLSMNK